MTASAVCACNEFCIFGLLIVTCENVTKENGRDMNFGHLWLSLRAVVSALVIKLIICLETTSGSQHA